MFVDGKGKLSKDLGRAIVNPNTSNANVSVTLRGNDENQLGIKTVNVPSHQRAQASGDYKRRDRSHYVTPASGTMISSRTQGKI
jgi:hypothetical protein